MVVIKDDTNIVNLTGELEDNLVMKYLEKNFLIQK